MTVGPAAPARPARARHAAAAAPSPWTGTTHLIWLALRRDRLRLAVWVTALTLTMLYTPNALELAYPEHVQRLTRVELMRTPAAMLMGGPMFGRNETDLGVMTANELMLTLIVATSILAILTVIRHTRTEECSGAAELVAASPVGRYARTAAALSLVLAVNVVIAAAMTVAMAASGFAVTDTAAMCIGVAAVAMVFGAVAAVTAQLWRTSRAATGAALATLALAALIRGIGDVIDNSGSVLSWFSPIAWAQQMRAFVDPRWWPLGLLVALTVALVAIAGLLEARREYDDAIVVSSGDHPGARPLRGVLGLHLVLQRGLTAGWAVALFLSGLAFGSMTKSLHEAAETNELIAKMLVAQGNDGIYTTMTQFLAAAASAYVATAVLRVHSDEQSGLAEAVLAGAVSRWRWLFSAVAAAVLGSIVLMFFAGLGNGLGAGITTGQPQTVLRLALAGLAYVPALAVMAAVAALAVALRRTWIAWLAVTFVIVALYLGALLRLPSWLIDLSPVGSTTVPTDVPVVAMSVMVSAAAAITVLAGWYYRSRDAA